MKKKKRTRLDVLQIIRYGIVLVIILYAGVLMYMKGNRDTAFGTVASVVEKAAGVENMTLSLIHI